MTSVSEFVRNLCPRLSKIPPDAGKAVKLAVQRDPDCFAFIRDGLIAIRNVNNRQPKIDERDTAPGPDVEAPAIRPPMRQHRRHSRHGAQVYLSRWLKRNLAGDAAHQSPERK